MYLCHTIRKKDGKVHRYWRLVRSVRGRGKAVLVDQLLIDRLLAHKAAIEAHLSRRGGELFSTDSKVLLYDVTSTYPRVKPEGML